MKKIIVSLLACAAMLTSCDMETIQPGVLVDTDAIQSATDARYFRNYLYSSLRSMTTGGYVYSTEIQCDQFIGLSTNGNRGAILNTGELESSNSTAESAFAGMYARIAQCNFFIEQAEALIDGGSLTDADAAEVKRYIGEAKFVRGYSYFYLMDHFCNTYDAATGDQEGKGLQLQLKYDPTGDTSKYPGRSSMNATIEVINNDLADAYTAIKAYEDAGNTADLTAGAAYLSSYAVEALQARVALVTGDYDTAITKSKSVINSGLYSLASGTNYVKMWNDQNTDELIFAPFVDVTESGSISSICEGWNYWWSSTNQSDYIPMEAVLFSYLDANNNPNYDIRFQAFFKYAEVNVAEGATYAYVFNKWPGNAALSPSTNMYLNTPKPFRISEQYLILAEAAAMTNQPDLANTALNTLRKARIATASYTDVALAGNALVTFVREERSRELIGEGFRLSDLRRWQVEWNRSAPYTLNPMVASSFLIGSVNTHYSATDYRYVWPIPATEMNITPALEGQQNPGYE